MTRTQDDLKEVSEHLHYELDMLTFLTRSIASGKIHDDVLSNARVESFAVHVRNLILFLFPFPKAKPKPDDVLATDFVSDPVAFEAARGVKSEILKKAKRMADKRVAHLTYERLKVREDNDWPFVQMANEINRVMTIFLQHADRSKLSEMWKA